MGDRLDRTTAQSERFEDWLIFHGFRYPDFPSSLDFEVVAVIGETTDGALCFEGVDDPNDWHEDPLTAPTFLHGDIKWDGCSNWSFDEQDRVMLHFCGAVAATGLGRLMRRMYEIASVRIQSFDRELAHMDGATIDAERTLTLPPA